MMLFRRRAMLGALLVAGLFITAGRHAQRAHADLLARQTCFITGGGALRVCHAGWQEGVFYKPSRRQVAYNTQIIALGNGRYATVLHSEAQDTARFVQLYGHVRAGDSIKSGVVDGTADPQAVVHAPPDLEYRIWGSLKHPASPLFYGIDPGNPAAIGLSGGGNPMVVRGQPGDPFFYMFYLGVMSDAGQGAAWRNVLLEARTKDFYHFDILQSGSTWARFAGEQAFPAVVRDVDGRAMVSNHPAYAHQAAPGARRKHPGINTAGLFGTIVLRNGVYDYFYTDQDATDPSRNHLYLRTAKDLTGDRRWSAPQIVMDVPPEIMLRVLPARGMDRWVVEYMCLRSVQPFISDICLQYTETMNITGPGGISALKLFEGPVYNGLSRYALGLIGANPRYDSGAFLKIQPYDLTDSEGGLAVPPDQVNNRAVGGLVTWNDLPDDYDIFGAATYWGEWTVTKVK